MKLPRRWESTDASHPAWLGGAYRDAAGDGLPVRGKADGLGFLPAQRGGIVRFAQGRRCLLWSLLRFPCVWGNDSMARRAMMSFPGLIETDTSDVHRFAPRGI